jgi:hypothetical protein
MADPYHVRDTDAMRCATQSRGRTERVTDSLFSAQARHAEDARAREADVSAMPVSMQGRRGPAQPTRAMLCAQRGVPLQMAGALRRAQVATNVKAQKKARARHWMVGQYEAWHRGLVGVDPLLRRLQPVPLPVCREVAFEFIYQLPMIVDGGLSRSDLRNHMLALNAASTAANGVAPFSGGDLAAKATEFDVLRHTCGVGKRRIRVSTITTEMFAQAELQIGVRQDWVFAGGYMLNEPYTGDPMLRLHAVEQTFFLYLATCGRDHGVWNESGLYEWTVLHLGVLGEETGGGGGGGGE